MCKTIQQNNNNTNKSLKTTRINRKITNFSWNNVILKHHFNLEDMIPLTCCIPYIISSTLPVKLVIMDLCTHGYVLISPKNHCRLKHIFTEDPHLSARHMQTLNRQSKYKRSGIWKKHDSYIYCIWLKMTI